MSRQFSSLFCFLVFVSLVNYSNSQNHDRIEVEADSLKNLLENATEDIARVDLLNRLSRVYVMKKKLDDALASAIKASSISKNIKYNKGIANSSICIGEIYRSLGELKKAEVWLNEALVKAVVSKDIKTESLVYDQLGHLKWSKGDTLGSLNDHKKSLEIRIKLKGSVQIAESYSNIAEIYSSLGKLKEASKYYKEALKYYQKANRTPRIAWAAGNVGLMQNWLGNSGEALKYFILALNKYEEDRNNEGFVWVGSLMSNIYKNLHDYEKAFKYMNDVHKVHVEAGDSIGIADALSLKGGIYFSMGDLQNSKKYFDQSYILYNEFKDSVGIMNSQLSIGAVYFESKEYDKALKRGLDASEIAVKLNNYRINARSNLLIGKIFSAKGEVKKARGYLNAAHKYYKDEELLNDLPAVYKEFVKLDSLEGDFQSAFENYKAYVQYKEMQNESHIDTEKIAMRYEFEKKQAIDAAELKNKKIERNAAILGLILSTLLVIVLIYVFRLRTKKVKIEKEKLLLQRLDIERVKETEEFKSRLLTNVTHEFRTPLTLIKGHLEVLKGEGREEDQFRFEEMDNNGNRLLLLINQLLYLSKMESGEYKLKYTAGYINNTITASTQAFKSLADQKKIDFRINSSLLENHEFDSFIYSQEALSIIISNLLSNAFKYTPQNGKVEVVAFYKDKETLILKISDSGIGIPVEFRSKVFDRFYQVESIGRRTFEGSGIGLSLVRELVIIHGGSVSLESSETGGCEFTINIKSAKSEIITDFYVDNVPGNNEASESQNFTNDTTENNELPLILVVEDQSELRRFIVDNLGNEYNYIEAVDGKEGIRLAEEYIPDLIISDVMMPNVDGLEMCKYLKSTLATSHIPIVLLTAKVEVQDRLKGLEIGANDYLVKPFSLAEIRLRVKNMMSLKCDLQSKFEGVDMPEDLKTSELNLMEREFIEKINNAIESNISNSHFGVLGIAEVLFLSPRQFSRKLKSVTGKTPSDYIRNFKLHKAIEILRDGSSVAEAGWNIGIEDPVYFSKVFKKHLGYPPSEVKK